MNSLINYFVEANICLLLFGGFYYLFLRKETDFRFSRVYLLSSTLLSLIVPLFHFDNVFSRASSSNIMGGMKTILLPVLTIGDQSSENLETGLAIFSWNNILGMAYLVVSLILFIIFLYRLYDIYTFYKLRKADVTARVNYYLIPTNGQLPTFSFFDLLFFDNSNELTPEEQSKIIDHEIVHIKEWHSLDIIMFELTKIVFWINPVVWIFRNHIEDIHEYIADQKIIKKTNESDYSSLLAKMALKKMSLSLGHHFNKSLTLKRITMMKKPSERIKSWKLAALAPIILLVIITFSCNDDVVNDMNEIMETSVQKEVPEHLKTDFELLKKNNPEANFVYMEFSGESEEAFQRLMSKVDEYDPNSIGAIDVNKEEKRIGVILNKNGALKSITKSEMTEDGIEIFVVVDEFATPPGGSFEEYYTLIAQTLRYPAQARKLGIEGKVYVQFIVQKDGSLSNVKVAKGIGGGCDREAKTTIENLKGWSPGKQGGVAINQRIVLPISFNLSPKKATSNGDSE